MPLRSRYASAALVAALLVATAVVFVITERLKLTPNPILGPGVDKIFSPVCECATDTAQITFRLRKRDTITVHILDDKRRVVRELARREPVRARVSLQYFWDGRDDAGRIIGEGTYFPRVRLAGQRRTIVLPNPIQVDTTPPVIVLRSLAPRVISPDGDLRRDRVVARYRVDEPARVALYVDGQRRTLKKGRRQQAAIDWNGRLDGRPVQAGPYRIELGASDIAGNVGKLTRSRTLTVRYVSLGRKDIMVAPGGRIRVLVRSDARALTWRLALRRGTAKPGTLRLVAPLRPGRYVLTVAANGFSARATVRVRKVARPRP